MKIQQFKTFRSQLYPAVAAVAPLLAVLMVSTVSPARAEEEQVDGEFSVPAGLQVPAGNKFAFEAHGIGVQIYVWHAATSSWVFQAPVATLFEDEGRVVGIHYAGPTWQNNDGSKVVGARLAAVSVNSNAIPWLLLQAASTAGPGVFADITFVQRLKTKGGLAPAAPGSFDGQQVLVPYSADYIFYHAQL